ncbi:MAG: protein translocase subunit SecD [Actinobacteria bacterium]|nr:MAG: protein translocase subunit SecD [Actinomycetota bacterium]
MSTTKRHPLRSLVVLLIAVAIAAGSLVFGHYSSNASYTPSLALDLEGGTQLILTPVSSAEGDREVTEADIAEAINVIRQRVDASGVAEAEIASLGTKNIVVALPGTPSQETLDLVRSSSLMDFRPVLQIAAGVTQPPTAISDNAGQSGAQSGPQSGMQTPLPGAQSGVTGDEDQSGAQSGLIPAVVPEAEAQQAADLDQDGTLSDTPATTPKDNSDPAWVTEQTMYDLLTLNCLEPRTVQASVADPKKPLVTCDVEGNAKYILGPVDVPGALLSSASAGVVTNSQGQATNDWGVDLQFDSEGTKLFAESSQRLYTIGTEAPGGIGSRPDRNCFAAVLDGRVITAPSMNVPITNGQAQITGSFTAESAKALANQLNFGSLPLNFEVQSEQKISATLGAEHLEKGIWAGIIGLILVVLYMLWQYRGLAALSAGSLLIAAGLTYLVITLLSWLIGYRLSLSGVAGLIVSVGITADSFIVYFERIRDEVRDGRPLVAAVSEGWDRAKRTILVSDAVNLVAAVILYVLAVGGVQGFAFTLGVTTIVDLIVIFLFTHPLMELLVRLPFFGQGHKLSGLDPEHLGARSSLIYAGRGRVVVRGKDSGAEEEQKSLAQKRREARRAKEAEHKDGDN